MNKLQRIAIVGAGMAGATCARLLVDAGCDVTVFDKSRGVGGRMATRRASMLPGGGTEQALAFDHGAPGYTARSAEFARFIEPLQRDSVVAHWQPRVATFGYVPLDDRGLWLPVPEMPALCRALLAGVHVQTECHVDALQRDGAGWRLHQEGSALPGRWDAVLVAVPPALAAPLLRPHRHEWARRADALPVLPCWALMAVTDAPAVASWDLAWPTSGALAAIVRNDAKPGRRALPGVAQWVAHATADWSQTHLHAGAAEVKVALQAALEEALRSAQKLIPGSGLSGVLTWHHAVVHRWRYASMPRAAAGASGCLWDAAAGLGACGDAWGGGGVEGAWRSARDLAAVVLDRNAA